MSESEEIIDIEEHTREGKPVPDCGIYIIKVNGDPFRVRKPCPTGREVLELAGLVPAEKYTLRVKVRGERPRRVELDEQVDLRKPGIEKFKALRRDQTEGRGTR